MRPDLFSETLAPQPLPHLSAQWSTLVQGCKSDSLNTPSCQRSSLGLFPRTCKMISTCPCVTLWISLLPLHPFPSLGFGLIPRRSLWPAKPKALAVMQAEARSFVHGRPTPHSKHDEISQDRNSACPKTKILDGQQSDEYGFQTTSSDASPKVGPKSVSKGSGCRIWTW